MPKEKKPRLTNARKNEIKYQKMLQNSEAERETQLQLFRQILIDSVAVCYPFFVDFYVILLISKIKYPQQISREEIEELLNQLVAEGMFIQTKDEPCLKSYRFQFNKIHEPLLKFQLSTNGHIYKFKDKILKTMLAKETEAERLVRLMRKRADNIHKRLTQYDVDVKTLYEVVIPSDKCISFRDILELLPDEWKAWKARYHTWYVMRCVLHLQTNGYLFRDEERDLYSKITKDIGY
jgi:hypothetical protein